VSNAAIAQIVREGKFGRIREALIAGAPQGMATLDSGLERLLEMKKITPETALERAVDKETFMDVVRRLRPDFVD
jgi:Tfp pilus assembly pilus retraction ATPase PilT